MRILIGFLVAVALMAQSKVVVNPFPPGSGLELVPSGTAGSGTVTSVTISPTANQITATGTCTGTTVITCTLALPSGLVLPGTINGLTITTTTGTITIANAKVLTVNNSLTLAGTDGVTLTFPATSATIARTDAAQTFAGIQNFSSSPTIPTASLGDSSTKAASTAFVLANAASATAGTCAWTLTATAQTLPLTQLSCTTVGGVATAVATGSAPYLTQSISGANFAAVTLTFPDWTETSGSHNISFLQGNTTLTAVTWPTTVPVLVSKSIYQVISIATYFRIAFDGTNYNASLLGSTSGVGYGAAFVTAPLCSGTNPNGFTLWPDSVDLTPHFFNGTCVEFSYYKMGVDANPVTGQVTATHLSAALPVNQGGTGTTSTLTGLVRGSGSAMTAAELSGDVTTSGSNAATIANLAVTNAKIAAGTIDLTAKVTGTLPVANGGTGITSLGAGVATALGTAVSGSGAFCLATASACSSGSGTTGTSVTNTTPVTANANSTSEQFLMELALGAGYLNSSGQPFLINGAFVYTTPAAQTPTITITARLCTVTVCGSGTNRVLATIVSTATLASVTNNTINFSLMAVNHATGATGTLEVHGPLSIDLGALTTTADSIFNDVNTAVSGTIDLTAALFVDFTVTFSTNAVGANSITQRSGGIMPFAATAAPVASVAIDGGAPQTGAVSIVSKITSVGLTVPPQMSVASSPLTSNGTLAVTFPALPNGYTADPNSPYVQGPSIRRFSLGVSIEAGTLEGIGATNTITGSSVNDAATATAPNMLHIVVANGSAVGYINPVASHRTGRTNGMDDECMGANTVITLIRVIPCGLTNSTLAQALAGDVPGAFQMAYIVFSTSGGFTTGTNKTTHYQFCTVDGTTQNCVDTGIPFDTSVHRFRVFENTAKWTGCVDTTCVDNATNNPASGTNLAAVVGAFGIGAASGNWQLAYESITEDWK